MSEAEAAGDKASTGWDALPRDYPRETTPKQAAPVDEHPLQPKEKAEPKPTGAAALPEVATDPLSLMAAAEAIDDPLGAGEPIRPDVTQLGLLRWLRCLPRVASREAARRRAFDWVLVARFDLLYFAPLPSLADFEAHGAGAH